MKSGRLEFEELKLPTDAIRGDSGEDGGRRRTCRCVKDEDAVTGCPMESGSMEFGGAKLPTDAIRGVIWPS